MKLKQEYKRLLMKSSITPNVGVIEDFINCYRQNFYLNIEMDKNAGLNRVREAVRELDAAELALNELYDKFTILAHDANTRCAAARQRVYEAMAADGTATTQPEPSKTVSVLLIVPFPFPLFCLCSSGPSIVQIQSLSSMFVRPKRSRFLQFLSSDLCRCGALRSR